MNGHHPLIRFILKMLTWGTLPSVFRRCGVHFLAFFAPRGNLFRLSATEPEMETCGILFVIITNQLFRLFLNQWINNNINNNKHLYCVGICQKWPSEHSPYKQKNKNQNTPNLINWYNYSGTGRSSEHIESQLRRKYYKYYDRVCSKGIVKHEKSIDPPRIVGVKNNKKISIGRPNEACRRLVLSK